METAEVIRRQLTDVYQRDHCVLVSRGTTGLYLVFDELATGSEVIFPSYMCDSPVYAALFADLTPRFADVRRRDYNIEPASVRERLTPDTAAVVPVHSFGHPADLAAIHDLVGERDVTIVEDACLRLPTTHEQSPLDARGDVIVTSFGQNKPINAGYGGAVLLDDEEQAMALRKKAKALATPDDERLQSLANCKKRIYHAVEDLTTIHPGGITLLEDYHEVFRESYLRGIDASRLDVVEEALQNLQQFARARHDHAALYRKYLTSEHITHPEPRNDAVLSKYVVGLSSSNLRNHVLEELRAEGFNVSTYYSLPYRFDANDACPTADDLAGRLIQLWTAEHLDDTYVRECSEAVLAAIASHSGA